MKCECYCCPWCKKEFPFSDYSNSRLIAYNKCKEHIKKHEEEK